MIQYNVDWQVALLSNRPDEQNIREVQRRIRNPVKNQRFSDNFRGYKNGTLVENGLNSHKKL